MRPSHLLAATLALITAGAHAATEARYDVLFQQTKGGELVVRGDDAGSTRVSFSYRDNGRGPDLDETWTLLPDGTLRSYRAGGKSTFGGAIDETFNRSGDRVTWQSLVDRGDSAAAPEAAFLPIDGSPAWFGHVVDAVWRRPGHTAPALPAGRLSVERIDTLTLRDTAGAETRVTLHALTGSNLTPDYVWLRDGDAQPAFFALTDPWYAVVDPAFAAAVPQLLARQEQAQKERLAQLAARLSHPLPGLTLIRNVRWFDAAAARMRGPSDVTLYGGRISGVLAPGSGPKDAAHVIDGSGRTLLPGLFDMHVHIGADEGLLHLAAGVTTVRDMGNVNADLQLLMKRFDSGRELGPRIVPAGFIEGQSPHASRADFVVASLDEAKAAVDWYAVRGYGMVKLYNSMRPEWVEPLAAYAHARGLRVGGHVPAFMRAEQAVAAGYDELTHINQVMLNFLVGPQDDTRTLLRFTLVGDKGGSVALDGARVDAFVALLKRRKTTVDPTAVAFEAMFNQRNGQPNPSMKTVADHLPVTLQRGLLSNSFEVNDANAARYRQSYAALLGLAARMHRAGVPLVSGTDDFAGFALHRELELYVQAGIPAPEVLRIATVNGARAAGVLADRGSIERGKRADLVLVDGDPSARIADIRRASLVIKGDVALVPAELHQALGVRPFTEAPPMTGVR